MSGPLAMIGASSDMIASLRDGARSAAANATDADRAEMRQTPQAWMHAMSALCVAPCADEDADATGRLADMIAEAAGPYFGMGLDDSDAPEGP